MANLITFMSVSGYFVTNAEKTCVSFVLFQVIGVAVVRNSLQLGLFRQENGRKTCTTNLTIISDLLQARPKHLFKCNYTCAVSLKLGWGMRSFRNEKYCVC